jgi:hypothetical protein
MGKRTREHVMHFLNNFGVNIDNVERIEITPDMLIVEEICDPK